MQGITCFTASKGAKSQRVSVTLLLDFRGCHPSGRVHGKGDPLLGYLEALQFTSSELQYFLALQCVYDAWIN